MANRYRRPYKPERGSIYSAHGGGVFRCMTTPIRNWSGYCATMQNIKSGWMFWAIGIHVYQDRTIDWDYSTNGRFSGGKHEEVQMERT